MTKKRAPIPASVRDGAFSSVQKLISLHKNPILTIEMFEKQSEGKHDHR